MCVRDVVQGVTGGGVEGEKGLDRPSLPHQLH